MFYILLYGLMGNVRFFSLHLKASLFLSFTYSRSPVELICWPSMRTATCPMTSVRTTPPWSCWRWSWLNRVSRTRQSWHSDPDGPTAECRSDSCLTSCLCALRDHTGANRWLSRGKRGVDDGWYPGHGAEWSRPERPGWKWSDSGEQQRILGTNFSSSFRLTVGFSCSSTLRVLTATCPSGNCCSSNGLGSRSRTRMDGRHSMLPPAGDKSALQCNFFLYRFLSFNKRYSCTFFGLTSQMQMVELLVAHGANLDSRSVLEETPLGENLTFFLVFFLQHCTFLP